MPGQSCKGVGVDCVHFVAGVLSELFGLQVPVPRHPSSLAVHAPREAFRTVKHLCRRFPHQVLRGPVQALEPGDIAVKRIGKGPGHVFIVGTAPYTAWHAVESVGVVQTGFSALTNIQRAWKIQEKATWLPK